jgi:cysteine-rich repeat protein
MEMDNKKQLVSCGNARIVEKINCDAVVQQCIPDCTGKVCGDSDGCGGSCTFCSGNNVCVQGLCEPSCQNNNQCSGGKVCVNNVCQLCGNGVWVADGEECDDGNTVSGDGCSSNCEVENGWSCESQPSVCS